MKWAEGAGSPVRGQGRQAYNMQTIPSPLIASLLAARCPPRSSLRHAAAWSSYVPLTLLISKGFRNLDYK